MSSKKPTNRTAAMIPDRMTRYLLFALMALLAVTASGCGKKGPVRPLEAPEPPSPAALEAEQLGESVVLFWQIGDESGDGAETQGFRIERMTNYADSDCLDCDEQWRTLAQVDLDYSRVLFRRENQLAWFDTTIIPGTAYRYRVFAYERTGIDSAPASATLNTIVPPPTPTGLQAQRRDGAVSLRWEAVDQPSGTLRYLLYRRSADAPFPPFPLTAEPLAEPGFKDTTADENRTYGYTVRTVSEQEGRRVQSVRSSEVRIPERTK
jgi:predicted small lipoprotein YifL